MHWSHHIGTYISPRLSELVNLNFALLLKTKDDLQCWVNKLTSVIGKIIAVKMTVPLK